MNSVEYVAASLFRTPDLGSSMLAHFSSLASSIRRRDDVVNTNLPCPSLTFVYPYHRKHQPLISSSTSGGGHRDVSPLAIFPDDL